jgi:hypothetical protein
MHYVLAITPIAKNRDGENNENNLFHTPCIRLIEVQNLFQIILFY